MSDEETKGLADFAAAGGTLVLEACAGMYDANGTIRERSLVHELFGVAALEVSVDDRVEWEWAAESGQVVEASGARYRQDMMGTADGIEVTGHFPDGGPAVCRIARGKGTVVWTGTLPSVAARRFGDAGAQRFIVSCLTAEAYPGLTVEQVGKDVAYRAFESETGLYLAAVNHGDSNGYVRYRVNGGFAETLTVPARDGCLKLVK